MHIHLKNQNGNESLAIDHVSPLPLILKFFLGLSLYDLVIHKINKSTKLEELLSRYLVKYGYIKTVMGLFLLQ